MNPQGNCIAEGALNNLEQVGEGAYGTVYKASWRTTDEFDHDKFTEVAVKILKNATKEKVFEERDRMASLDHVNVIRLLGFVQQKNAVPWLVMEYMSRGDLLSYVLEHDGLQARLMMRIGWGIARGMEYLHGKGIVHGDLAARNCLLGRHCNVISVKIGDLGFHDATNADDYMNYNASPVPCPIRWMPPENLPYELVNGRLNNAVPKHTIKGDIWAYGVVLFEMWSRGEKPFKGFTDFEVCRKLLNKEKPTHECKFNMRQHARNLMHNCWKFNPNRRLGLFSSILEHFEEHEGFQSNDQLSETSTVDSEPDNEQFDSDSDY